MFKVLFENKSYLSEPSETVLDCLLRHQLKIANSCRNGICQSCLLKTNSVIDKNAQKGLSPSKIKSGAFLSCQQKVVHDLEVFQANESHDLCGGTILDQERVTDSVVVVTIKLNSPFSYRAGQFINLIRSDGLSRPYSIANSSGQDQIIIHIRKIPGGVISNWLYDKDVINTQVTINGPLGECYLRDDMINDQLLLIGTGTGLAPLYGIVQDALAINFPGKIFLYHGGLNAQGLYHIQELKKLEKQHQNLQYFPVVLTGGEQEGLIQGDLIEIIKKHPLNINSTTTIVCGDPTMVNKIKQTIFIRGVPSKKIHSDNFVIGKK